MPSSDASERLRLVLDREPALHVTGEPTLVQSNSNDVWRIADLYLRVCWRGDRARLVREAHVVASLPEDIPYPEVVAAGGDGSLSWMATRSVDAPNLGEIWPALPRTERRDAIRARTRAIRALHEWQPPPPVAAVLRDRPPPDLDDPMSLVGADANPVPMARVRLLLRAARGLPYVPREVIDDTERLLDELAPLDPYSTGEPLVVTHGDATIFNVLWSEGRLRAFLDFEWARWGARDMDLSALLYTGRVTSRAKSFERMRTLARWVSADYPELFDHPQLTRRVWLYKIASALRALVVWPPSSAHDAEHSFVLDGLRQLLREPTIPEPLLA